MDAVERRTIFEQSVGGIIGIVLPTGLVLALLGAAVRLAIALVSSFEESAWVSTTSLSKGYLAIVGIVLVPLIMPRFIAHGVTRRAFSIGSAAVLLGSSAAMAVLITAGYGIEEAANIWAGTADVLGDRSVFGSLEQFAIVLSTAFLLHAAYFAGGWLVGTGYARWGVTGLAPIVPVGLGLVALAETLIGLDNEWRPVSNASAARLTIDLPARLGGDLTFSYLGAAVAVTLAVVLGTFAAAQMTRRTQVS